MDRLGRILLPGATALLVALALPALASANDYCVQVSCPGTDVNSIEDAFSLAKISGDADRVFLGGHEYGTLNQQGFVYDASGPIEIVGAGPATVLTGPSGGWGVLTLKGGPGSSVHDLTVKLPQYAQGYGLYTSNGARRIDVVEHADQLNMREGVVRVSGGTLEDSEVQLVRDGKSTAVALGAGGGILRRSDVAASKGVLSQYGDTVIERSRVQGLSYGVRALGGVTTIRSSRIHAIGPDETGIRAEAQNSDTTVNADGVTVTTGIGATAVGIGATTELAPALNAEVNLTNSVVRGGGAALLAHSGSASPGAGYAKVAASYSDYDPSRNDTTGGHAALSEANVSNSGDGGFVSEAFLGFRLLPTSPLVDAGDPATPQGLDLDGNALVADGNGDGIARRDIGAFELQPGPAPDDGGGAGGGGPAADTTAPLVSGFRATPAVFTVARASTPASARAARGTRLRYSLSEPARVTVAIKRAVKRGGRVRYRTVGTLKRSGTGGANSIRFTGRIGKRALRPGRHRAVIRATDAAGNRGAPKRIALRITRR